MVRTIDVRHQWLHLGAKVAFLCACSRTIGTDVLLTAFSVLVCESEAAQKSHADDSVLRIDLVDQSPLVPAKVACFIRVLKSLRGLS